MVKLFYINFSRFFLSFFFHVGLPHTHLYLTIFSSHVIISLLYSRLLDGSHISSPPLPTSPRAGQDFSPTPRSGVGMDLDFLDLPYPAPPYPHLAPR